MTRKSPIGLVGSRRSNCSAARPRPTPASAPRNALTSRLANPRSPRAKSSIPRSPRMPRMIPPPPRTVKTAWTSSMMIRIWPVHWASPLADPATTNWRPSTAYVDTWTPSSEPEVSPDFDVPPAIGRPRPSPYADTLAERIAAGDDPEPPATSSRFRCQIVSVVRLALELVEWPSPVQPPVIVAAAEVGNTRARATSAPPTASRRAMGMDIAELLPRYLSPHCKPGRPRVKGRWRICDNPPTSLDHRDPPARTPNDGHRIRDQAHDERGGRRPESGAHLLLLVHPGRPRPDRHRSRRRHLPVHARGPADHRLQQRPDVGEHRPRRPSRDRRDHRAGHEAPVRDAGLRHRDSGAPRAEARRDPAGRPRQGVLHARRGGSDRERDQARPPPHRPAQGPCPLPRVPRRDVRGHDADRRPAPLGERARPRRRGPLPGHASLGRERAAPGRGEPAGPRGRDPLRGRPYHRRRLPRDDRRHERHPHPARRLPAGRPRHLHAQRHPHGLR